MYGCQATSREREKKILIIHLWGCAAGTTEGPVAEVLLPLHQRPPWAKYGQAQPAQAPDTGARQPTSLQEPVGDLADQLSDPALLYQLARRFRGTPVFQGSSPRLPTKAPAGRHLSIS